MRSKKLRFRSHRFSVYAVPLVCLVLLLTLILFRERPRHVSPPTVPTLVVRSDAALRAGMDILAEKFSRRHGVRVEVRGAPGNGVEDLVVTTASAALDDAEHRGSLAERYTLVLPERRLGSIETAIPRSAAHPDLARAFTRFLEGPVAHDVLLRTVAPEPAVEGD